MERDGDIITFSDRDRFRYGGLGRKEWLPIEAAPELFRDVVSEKERVGLELQAVLTGNAHLKPAQELYAKANLTREFSGLDLFLRELGKTAGDVIIDFDVPAAL